MGFNIRQRELVSALWPRDELPGHRLLSCSSAASSPDQDSRVWSIQMVQGVQTLEPCLGTLGEGSMALATGMDVAHQHSGAGMSLANLVSIQSSFGVGIL